MPVLVTVGAQPCDSSRTPLSSNWASPTASHKFWTGPAMLIRNDVSRPTACPYKLVLCRPSPCSSWRPLLVCWQMQLSCLHAKRCASPSSSMRPQTALRHMHLHGTHLQASHTSITHIVARTADCATGRGLWQNTAVGCSWVGWLQHLGWLGSAAIWHGCRQVTLCVCLCAARSKQIADWGNHEVVLTPCFVCGC